MKNLDILQQDNRYVFSIRYVVSPLIAALLLIPISSLTLLANVPKSWAPLPMLVVLPVFFLPVQVQVLTFIIPSLLFLLWGMQLFRGQSFIPLRTKIALPILIGLSLIHDTMSWPYGIRYQGLEHTLMVCSINGLWVLALVAMLVIGIRRQSYPVSMALHWLIFAWLAWSAFPWLGELL